MNLPCIPIKPKIESTKIIIKTLKFTSLVSVVRYTLYILLFLYPLSAIAQQGPLPVDVANPLVKKVIDWGEYTGRFEAVQRVDIRPRVSGFLEAINFRDGQLVSKGDLLFKIDPRPFQTTLDGAEAELDAAKAEQTRTTLELEHGEDLVARRTLSIQVLDERRAAKLRADAQIAIAEVTIRAVELNVEFTEVRAPFAGRISDRKVDVGGLIIESNTVLGTLLATDPIHLVFTASEADFLKYSRLNKNGSRESSRSAENPVEARLIDEQGWPHKGTMNFVDNELDASAGTIRGRALFDNDDDSLTPGLFARLRLIGSGEYEGLLLPDEAILSDQARKIVYVVDAEDTISAKVVELGPIYEGSGGVIDKYTGDGLWHFGARLLISLIIRTEQSPLLTTLDRRSSVYHPKPGFSEHRVCA